MSSWVNRLARLLIMMENCMHGVTLPYTEPVQVLLTYTCVPTQIGSASNWAWVTIGGYMGAAINTDGELYTWGYNSDGQLGLGDTVTRSEPTQVGSLTNWKYIEVTNLQMYGIKTDGTFWSWGAGSATEGNPRNDSTGVCSPVQVGSRTDWLAPVRTGGSPMGAWNSAT